MESYNGQLLKNTYEVETRRSYSKKHGTIYHKYCNDILTFDIEVTSGWLKNGKVIGYTPGETSEYWNCLVPVALPYLWQFSFNDKVYYGREFRDFRKVLDDLPCDTDIVIWVHNLSYEFHFLNNILTWKKVFARSPHKPMKCVSYEYPNIEFRCSYMLTRLSLDSWGKQLGVHKMTGDLDYEKIRTPLTPLTDKEMKYGEQDCLVVYHGIKEYKKRYGNIRDIPLTQTGTVRRVVKDLLMSNPYYCKKIKKLIPYDTEEYKMLMDIFAGGYTHANRRYSGMVQKGIIEHYDFASSYPTVMVAEKYPSSPWMYLGDDLNLDSLPGEIDDWAFILRVKFKNIECQTFNTYIQSSKCDGKGFELDNGRVLSADELEMFMTEQDWLTIKETYSWDSVELVRAWKSKKEYLPKLFVNYILELYKNKTTLKGVEGMEDLYQQSKQYINSMFGMCVTAIVQPDVTFEDNMWEIKELTEEYVQERLDKLRTYTDKRYFLSYSWGCWVTAYARRNLWKCIESVDNKVLYCDTDSIFVKDKQDFKWYNKDITKKLKKACEEQGLDFAMTHPKTPKGIEKPLGIFDKEDNCSEFITLGAKRYVERRVSDNKLHLTVSGINKDAVELLNDNIKNFKDGFNFDKDAPCVHKQLGTYLIDMPKVTYPDGYISTYTDGINLRRNGYLLTMTDEYKNLINYMNFNTGDLDDGVIIRMKGMF